MKNSLPQKTSTDNLKESQNTSRLQNPAGAFLELQQSCVWTHFPFLQQVDYFSASPPIRACKESPFPKAIQSCLSLQLKVQGRGRTAAVTQTQPLCLFGPSCLSAILRSTHGVLNHLSIQSCHRPGLDLSHPSRVINCDLFEVSM